MSENKVMALGLAVLLAGALCFEAWRYSTCVGYTHSRGVCVALLVGR